MLRPNIKSADKKEPQTARCKMNLEMNFSYNHYILVNHIITEMIRESHSVVFDFLQPHGLYSPWNSLGQNIGVGSLSLLQGIFPTQESNPFLLHCRCVLYQLSHKGNPNVLQWVAYTFSSRSS